MENMINWIANTGMIIRETPPTANDVYKARATVQQTYDYILKDIDYAIEYAPDFTSSDYASKLAAKALKIKILFYMGKYEEALEAANTFIGNGERELVSPYASIFTDFSNKELIYTRGFAGTDEVKYQATRVQAYYNEGKWGPTPSFAELVRGDPREEVILKNGVGGCFRTSADDSESFECRRDNAHLPDALFRDLYDESRM